MKLDELNQLDQATCSELLDELVFRLKTTNGIEFIYQKDIDALVNTLSMDYDLALPNHGWGAEE